MAGIAEELRTSPYVMHPVNLDCFLMWADQAGEDHLDEVMEVVHTVERPLTDYPTGPGDLPPIVISRPDLGRSWTMRQLQWEESSCFSAYCRFGGRVFCWIGPWTCPTIVGDENTTVEEVIRRAAQCGCGRHSM